MGAAVTRAALGTEIDPKLMRPLGLQHKKLQDAWRLSDASGPTANVMNIQRRSPDTRASCR